MHNQQNSPDSLAHTLLIAACSAVNASPNSLKHHGVKAILENVLAKNALAALLDDLCAQPQALEWSMSQSTPHPLGFDKIILARANGYTLRCHIWKPSDGYEHIHNHAASFASRILSGGYVERRFQLATSTEETRVKSQSFWNFMYPSGFGLEMCQPVLKGQVFLQEIAEMRRQKGDQFVVPHDELHMTEKIVASVPTISVLIQAPIQTQWTDVFVKSSVLEEHQKMELFTRESFRVALESLRDAVR